MRRLAALACVVLAAGCSSKPQGSPPAAAADAGAHAGAELALEAPRSLHLVAVSRSDRIHIERMKSGVLLSTELFQFEARDDGELVRVGDAASYAALLADGDDDLGGYDVPRHAPIYGVYGTSARPILDGDGTAFAWDGHAWTHAPQPERPQQATTAGVDAPPRSELRRVRAVAAGRLVLGRFDGAPGALLVKDGERSGVVLRFDTPHDACEFVDDPEGGKTHVLCSPRRASNVRSTLHAFVDDHFETVAIPDDVTLGRVVAIGKDGAVWTAEPNGIVRVASSGRIDRFAYPSPEASLARPSYRMYPELTTSQGDNLPALRTWNEAIIADAQEILEPTHDVDRIIPSDDGRAWILARDKHWTHHVLHVGPHATKAAFAIGSGEDQRNEVRNARGVRTWVGHCHQLFVSLGGPERVWPRVKDVGDVVLPILARDDKAAGYRHAVVAEGRLGERRVAGALVWRVVPDVKEATIENAARTLAARFTENPAAPPEITCTAPVLDRVQAL